MQLYFNLKFEIQCCQEIQDDFLKIFLFKHFVYFLVFWWCNLHIMCYNLDYFCLFSLNNLEIKAFVFYFGGWRFLFLLFERLKVFVFSFEGWRFLFLFLERWKAFVFALRGWRFLFLLLKKLKVLVLVERLKALFLFIEIESYYLWS